MKLLILSAYFYPEKTSSLHLNIDKFSFFADMNIDMEMIVPFPTRGIDEETKKEYRSRKTENIYNGKLVIHRFPMYDEGKNPFGRFIRYLLCNIIQLVKGLCSKKIDLVYCDSTPPIQGITAALISKIKNIPFVYNLQDIFPESLYMTDILKEKNVIYKIGKVIEMFIYKSADKIIVISEAFKENLIQKGIPDEKIEVVYNWVDTEKIVPVSKENNTIYEEFGLDRNMFYITYAGNFGNAQNIDVLLDVAEKTLGNKDIGYVLFGTGGREELYKQIVKEKFLKNVKILPLQPPERISEVYSLGDLSFVSCKPGAGGIALPSKMWGIMASGTAVLANYDTGSEIEEIITKNKVGVFTEAGNVDELTHKVLEIYNTFTAEMGKNARLYIEHNVSKSYAVSRYYEIIKMLYDRYKL